MIKKGSIYKVELPKRQGSHLQGGVRPVLVVSGNQKNKGNIVNIVPLTTCAKRRDLYTHIPITGYGLPKASMTLCEHAMPIDKCDLKSENYIGLVPDQNLLEQITLANQMQFVWLKTN